MKKLLGFLLLVIVVLAAIMVVRTLRLPGPAAAAPAASAAAAPAIDSAAVAARLAGAVRYPTVSLSSGGPIDTAAFLGLQRYIDSAFPLVHAQLAKELINGLSLVYTWQGADLKLDPVVFMGHMDVVPVPDASLGKWTHQPFSGDYADGFVWGRGTLDDKVTVFSILEAVEGLLKSGYKPPRTIYLTFGHDEEVGGRYGARLIVETLTTRGIKPALILDEGGFMAAGLMPGLSGQVAVVGIAEKGYVSLRLTALADGGHSSMPTARTSIGALSRAVAKLEDHQFPMKLDGPTRGMVEAMAPYVPFPRRVMLANLWLTGPLVSRMLAGNPLGAALQHTTTAPTMLTAGIKDNVLPPEAQAIVNFRIRPGETVTSVMARVNQVIGDSGVVVSRLDSVGVDPSRVSDVTSPAYRLIAETIRGISPAAPPPVIPYLVMGGTDAKYWGTHSDRAFRFLPVPLGAGDRERIHGIDERVAIADYATAIGFFTRLLQGLDRL